MNKITINFILLVLKLSFLLSLCSLFVSVEGTENFEEEEEDEDDDEYIDLTEMGSKSRQGKAQEDRIEGILSLLDYIFRYILTSRNMQALVTLSGALPILVAFLWRFRRASLKFKFVAGLVTTLVLSVFLLVCWNVWEGMESRIRHDYNKLAVLEYVPKNCRLDHSVTWQWIQYWTGFYTDNESCYKFNTKVLGQVVSPLGLTTILNAISATWTQIVEIW